MQSWLLLIASIPGTTKAPRMRVWRALKAAGAATLRDGVYLLPDSKQARDSFGEQAADIHGVGGSATVLPLLEPTAEQATAFAKLFDRRADHDRLASELRRLPRELGRIDEPEARRRLAAMRKEVAALDAIDFFPTRHSEVTRSALAAAESAINRTFSPNEPRATHAAIERLGKGEYRGRTWATRRHLWIDRVCSAWLIRRFVDAGARFLWLEDPERCPKDALGFDFDGAKFTHTDGKVTFEVLAASFGLAADPALAKLGALVHYLDVGGAAVTEAAGVEAIMVGARATRASDDEILETMSGVLDCLYAGYAGAPPATPQAQRRPRKRRGQ